MENLIQDSITGDNASCGLSVMIVDNRDEAFFLEQNILSAGHVVQVAVDYSEALEKINRGTFDLIIMEMNLPDGDWCSTVKKIRKHSENIHIIAMTGNNSREIEELARENKVIYYAVKPLDALEIKSVISHIFKRKNLNTT